LTGEIANVLCLRIKTRKKALYIGVSYCDNITGIKTKIRYIFLEFCIYTSKYSSSALPKIKAPVALTLRSVITKGNGITLPSTYLFDLQYRKHEFTQTHTRARVHAYTHTHTHKYTHAINVRTITHCKTRTLIF